MKIELLDTTLRDGEQTSGVSFTPSEKLSIAQNLLTELNISRIEIASARVSSGEFESVKGICEWAQRAGFINRIEILGFIDNGKSIKWVSDVGGKVINLLAKGSLRHCREQLGKSPEAHFADIANEVKNANACLLYTSPSPRD